jgi:hypothetical protein
MHRSETTTQKLESANMSSAMTQQKSNSPYPSGRKATTGVHDLNLLFQQAQAYQDLLRFEHDSGDIDPTVSVIQEYSRAIRLQYIRTRWSRLGLMEWHSEMQILLNARASMYMGLNIWDPLDDFFDTYVFEMEIQPQSDLDARGRKVVKRGLLKQLQETAARELENCHKTLCDMLDGKISNWRILDGKLLTFKKKVLLDCEERGSLCLAELHDISTPSATHSFASPSTTASIPSFTPPPSEFSYSSYSTESMPCYTTPPAHPQSDTSSWTTDSACYTPPQVNYQFMYGQPFTC